MTVLKYLTLPLSFLLLIIASSLAAIIHDNDNLGYEPREESDDIPDDQLFDVYNNDNDNSTYAKVFTFVTSVGGTESTQISLASVVYGIMWMVVFGIVTSAVLCYWVGCETVPEITTTTTSAPLQYGAAPQYTYGGRSIRQSFNPYSIDWEKFSILDWIAIGQEAYEKFDPADADCQLRLICELHQNTSKFGLAAHKMVDFFSYLQFTQVLSLPDEIKVLVEEWLNAADMGRNNKKECGEVFQTCDFSVNKMVDKYTHNEI